MERDVLLTQEGFEKLNEELRFLQEVKRLEVAERIRVAREFGDISENSEFDDAKNEQAMIEKEIAKLEERLRAARIIDPTEASADAVAVGLRVKVKDVFVESEDAQITVYAPPDFAIRACKPMNLKWHGSIRRQNIRYLPKCRRPFTIATAFTNLRLSIQMGAMQTQTVGSRIKRVLNGS